LREGILDAETATTVHFESSIAVSGTSGPDKLRRCPLSLAIFFAGKTSTILFLSFVSLRPPLDKRSLLTFGNFSGSSIHRDPYQQMAIM
jgi:hypothetical protein